MLANVAAWSAQVMALVAAVALVLRAFNVTEPRVRSRLHGVLLVSFLLPLLQPWHVSFTAPPDAIALAGASNDLRQFDREVTATVSWWSEISWSRLALFVLIGGMGLRGALLLLGAVRACDNCVARRCRGCQSPRGLARLRTPRARSPRCDEQRRRERRGVRMASRLHRDAGAVGLRERRASARGDRARIAARRAPRLVGGHR